MSKVRKTIIVYMIAALFAFIFDRVYSIFSHGVTSASMSLLWVWLLCSGAGFYVLTELISVITKKSVFERLPMNIYNSGVSVIASSMLLQGILEIAGTGSEYIVWYKVTGILLIAAGSILLLAFHLRR